MPEVSVILSGTSTLDQLKDNLRIFEHAVPNVMSEEDRKLIENIREIFKSKSSIGCTGCKYCMPCPKNVSIPAIFKLFSSYQIVKPHIIDKVVYQNTMIPTGSGADQCVSCGICMRNCPQGLKIPDLLKTVHEEFMEK